MPEYLHPGVYIQEESSGAKPIEGASTSTAAFVGLAPRGRPNRAAFITSWAEYVRRFGGLDKTSDMSLAVYQFFQNGGKRTYIVRALSADALAARAVLTIGTATVKVVAAGAGAWGNDITVKWRKNKFNAATFDFEIELSSGEAESYSGLGASEGSERFYYSVLNRDSQLIRIETEVDLPTDVVQVEYASSALSAGSDTAPAADGTSTPVTKLNAIDAGNALAALNPVDDASILVIPGCESEVIVKGLEYVESRRDMIYVVDSERPGAEEEGSKSITKVKNLLGFDQPPANAVVLTKSKYAALYFPWVYVSDPFSKVENSRRLVPPSGMIAGLYARIDNTRGVWKAPAGFEATLSGILGVQTQLTDVDQDGLNPIGVNCIRTFAAAGTVVWGARTLATQSDPEYRYVPVRRTAMFLEKSLYRGTQWVVFEPNDEPLWSSIRFNLNAFMTTLFRAGAFQGGKPSDAFLVKCDADNNIQATIDAGQVHILVAFAPLKPAEFVIIHITQLRKE